MANKKLKKLRRELNVALRSLPSLRGKLIYGAEVSLVGDYTVYALDNRILQSYDIRIELPSSYPYGFPQLFETSNKITPRCDDRHISSEGLACLEMEHLTFLEGKRGITIREFVEKYVHKYFCWQVLYDAGKQEKLKSWKHDFEGVVEFYCELLNTQEILVVIRFLEAALVHPDPYSPCFCDSGRKIKFCHCRAMKTLMAIGERLLNRDLILLKKAA